MADVVLWIVLVLLVVGVVGSILPVVPGAAISLVGLVLYAATHGLDELGLIPFVLLVGITLLALVFDLVAGIVSSRLGGASTRVALLGVLVGIVLTATPLGPIGLLVGIGGTVFVARYRETEDWRESLRGAAYATVGVLASNIVQAILTAIVLVVFFILVVLPAL